MNPIEKIKQNTAKLVNRALAKRLVGVGDLIFPPKPEFGDLSLPCFALAKKFNKTAVEMAELLVRKIKLNDWIIATKAIGPYLNFTFNKTKLAIEVIKQIGWLKDNYGKNQNGGGKRIMVEFAHPNTHKSFHIGHLRNIFTGEAVARILADSGYEVIRANYQGDIGLHIVKCLWGINHLPTEYKLAKKAGLKAKASFLGQAYALGSKNFEEDKAAKQEIIALNQQLYKKDKRIKKIYEETRDWSLKYFAGIYHRVGTKFDRLYFESEVADRGREIVVKNLKQGIFKVSDGAVIFEGEKYGLHNRVFLTTGGNPTYEAKDLGLAELQFKEFSPEKIIHIVGPEQAEYFKVVFKALELVLPKTKAREVHVPYGWVRLKEGKMSSRLGNVILGEWLLDEVKQEIKAIVEKNKKLPNKEKIAEKITLSAVKYSILKNGLTKDIAFDINESISLSGNSGPYLQYTYARINSIMKKSKLKTQNSKLKLKSQNRKIKYSMLSDKKELELIMKLARYPEAVELAEKNFDPSEVAKYLFELAQMFNEYYHSVPVLKTKAEIRQARLALVSSINQVIANGLNLLGIEVVEEM